MQFTLFTAALFAATAIAVPTFPFGDNNSGDQTQEQSANQGVGASNGIGGDSISYTDCSTKGTLLCCGGDSNQKENGNAESGDATIDKRAPFDLAAILASIGGASATGAATGGDSHNGACRSDKGNGATCSQTGGYNLCGLITGNAIQLVHVDQDQDQDQDQDRK